MTDKAGAYEEIMNALAIYFGNGELVASSDSIYEIISQDHSPIETIADALDEYRARSE